jgi:hypothetical protein
LGLGKRNAFFLIPMTGFAASNSDQDCSTLGVLLVSGAFQVDGVVVESGGDIGI